MVEGTVIFAYCDVCGEETAHRILKGTLDPEPGSGFDGTVQCVTCQTIHSAQIPVEKPVEVKVIISEKASSEKVRMEFGPNEVLRTEDELIWNEHNILVTSIESDGKRVNKAAAGKIDCIWTKFFDSVQVKVSVVKGSNTQSEKVEAAPEEEFAVGDILEFGRKKVMIDKIKTVRGMLYREGIPVEARDIKRIYSKEIKERRY